MKIAVLLDAFAHWLGWLSVCMICRELPGVWSGYWPPALGRSRYCILHFSFNKLPGVTGEDTSAADVTSSSLLIASQIFSSWLTADRGIG